MSIAVLIFDGAEELDFIGPWEMLTMWASYADGPRLITTVAERAGPVTCAKGLKVIADNDLSGSYNIVLVPGGYAVFDLLNSAPIKTFLQRHYASGAHILSVCTGAFFLHEAGLLKGREATTHWKAMDRLRALPDVTAAHTRYVNSGQVWTAAGVSAGIDMALAFIAHMAGEHAAHIVQKNAEYYPEHKLYTASGET
ncbi:MAG: DJ-1/PfpI family protein [Pseudomonadota bacterium]